MAVTVKINEHGVTLNGNPTIGLSGAQMKKIELQRNHHMKNLPAFCLYYHELRAWVSEEDGQKLIAAGATLLDC